MNELEKVTGPDWPEVQKLITSFRLAAQDMRPDRNKLSQLAAQAFALELKYASALNEQAKQNLRIKNPCLLTSLGMRIQPVLLSIAALKPKSIVFVHTKESRNQVDEIKNSAGWKGLFAEKEPFATEIQINPVDTTTTYEQLAKVVKLSKKSNWVVDITGGKKVMSATLSAFAFWRRIPVVYWNAKETLGVPEPFSERLSVIDNPYDTYGDPLLKAAESAFNNHQFSAAIQALKHLRDTISIVGLDHMASVASNLIECYMLWDRFEHSNEDKKAACKFYETFEQAAEHYRRFKYNFFDSGVFDANMQFLTQLKNTYQPSKKSLIDEFRLVDVFCNSCRRAKQNLFDDAVARLYRCTEMATTMQLKKIVPKFDPNNADWDSLCKVFDGIDLTGIYVKKSEELGYESEGLPKIRQIGLAQQIILLATIAEAIGQRRDKFGKQISEKAEDAVSVYNVYKSEKEVFNSRNRSILAHGTEPLGDKLYEDFANVVIKICHCVIGQKQWDKLRNQAGFPQIKFG